ncbi:ubiquinol oxidase subunit II [Sphingomonas sp. H39-1-10]|uniref:ubiquinol oxidase subunit II n=1 Tax=Sphingomonadales TaxID=204457 RepID=UPI001F5BB346|nr:MULTISPECIES: ubiquinol oxidase subunit II [Sphingomonadaceae]MDF0490101.1 ubiquinol oxidase subunit II [Sphingomonas pollutisoli]
MRRLLSSARALVPLAALLLAGCDDYALLFPKGDVGVQERSLILIALGIMLAVVIPVIILTLVFAWRYRATNTKANYQPKWSHSNGIEFVIWTIPCLIVLFLAVMIWETTHKLDPYQPLDSKVPPVRVEVVALNWKWLFIYPDYGIATVNELPIPAGTPINFKLTADSIMNSFFIPHLGSQVYAMGGMQTQLHLIADHPGTYPGRSSAYSGSGFSDMHFQAVATDRATFDAWVRKVQRSQRVLDKASYTELAKPSIKNAPTTYARVDPELFDDIVNQYMPAMTHPAHGMAKMAMVEGPMRGPQRAKTAE